MKFFSHPSFLWSLALAFTAGSGLAQQPVLEEIRDQVAQRGASGYRVEAAATAKVPAGARLLVFRERGARPGLERVLTGRLLVKLKPGATVQELRAVPGVQSVVEPAYAKGCLVVQAGPGRAALDLQQVLRQWWGVASAEPMLTKPARRRFTPNDSFYANNGANAGYLWHLKNTGGRGGTAGVDLNIETAWNTRKGTGIHVGIVDDGYEATHPDLSANHAADAATHYDFWENDTNPAPAPGTDEHSTACAGLVSGRGNNAAGICGVAFQATLHNLRIGLDAGIDDFDAAEALAFRNDLIHIKSCSWGPSDTGDLLEAPGELTLAALEQGTATGRGGAGTIYVFSAGNGAEVGDDANYDGFSNSIYTIGVAAVSDKGTLTDYAEPGASVVISAPSSSAYDQGISTTDRSGAEGYNTTGGGGNYTSTAYTNDFGGTSASAPQVAGVAALMLEARPTLGWRDVQEIFIATARQVSAKDSDWATNSGGYRFHRAYGAGLVDATAAVARAATWTNLAAQQQVARSTAAPQSLADLATSTFSFPMTPAENIRVEHVTLAVTISHTRRGDLAVELVSPSGMRSQLAQARADNNAHLCWKFMSVRHWGESSVGEWKVRITDDRGGVAGELVAATLTVHGTPQAAPSGVPVVTSPAARSLTAKARFSYQITAHGQPTSFSATGLPAWASLNTATGLLTGTPPAAGNVALSLRASNAAGNSTALVLTLTTTALAATSFEESLDWWENSFRTTSTTNHLWARTTTAANTHDGVDAMLSGAVPSAGGESSLSTYVEGPKVVSFWWKCATEPLFDPVQFFDGSVLLATISGNQAWKQERIFLPTGRHLAEWYFQRDDTGGSTTGGNNRGHVDQVSFSDPGVEPPLIVEQPVSFTAGMGQSAAFTLKAIGREPLTYQWRVNGVVVPGQTGPLLHVVQTPAGTSTVLATVSNGLGSVTTDPVNLVSMPTGSAQSLATALDLPGTSWGTSGDGLWFAQSTFSVKGGSALRSGDIADNGFSVLHACLYGPARLSYQIKCSSEPGLDFLLLTINGQGWDSDSGATDWRVGQALLPPGPAAVELGFYKDSSDTVGLDAAFFDSLTVIPTGYQGWLPTHFTPAQFSTAQAAITADPDGDGKINAYEYSFGSDPQDPLHPPSSHEPVVSVSGGSLRIQWGENTELQDVIYMPETSEDLLQWTALASATEVGSPVNSWQKKEVLVPMLPGSRKFVRMSIRVL